MNPALDHYRRLRDRIDRRSGRLVDMHCKHITCKAGCSDCCTDFSVFPVEYHAILDDLRGAGIRELPDGGDAACAFLRDGLCTLYRFRPLICRTHGLPVAFLTDDDGAAQMAVSFCPKNFGDAAPADLEFGPQNTLDLDDLNQELSEINERFTADAGASPSARPRRIPLRQLKADLASS
jgi:Fe-S-cluster containining protein